MNAHLQSTVLYQQLHEKECFIEYELLVVAIGFRVLFFSCVDGHKYQRKK